MKQFGEIKAILNEEYVLVYSSETLNKNSIVTVFNKIDDERLVSLLKTSELFYPKGELEIICSQKENLYLAKRFREYKEQKKRISNPAPWANNLFSIAKEFYGETKEIVEKIPGPWSAHFDLNDQLGINFDCVTRMGDPIGSI